MPSVSTTRLAQIKVMNRCADGSWPWLQNHPFSSLKLSEGIEIDVYLSFWRSKLAAGKFWRRPEGVWISFRKNLAHNFRTLKRRGNKNRKIAYIWDVELTSLQGMSAGRFIFVSTILIFSRLSCKGRGLETLHGKILERRSNLSKSKASRNQV